MTRNKKKLRRAERRNLYIRTAQSLVLTGLLMAGGAGAASVAQAALSSTTWGDAQVSTSESISGTVGVWRDFTKLPNSGNLTISTGATLTVNFAGNLVVGDGNLLVQSGGTLAIMGGKAQISQGSLTFADGARLSMVGDLFSFGDITAAGTLANFIDGRTLTTSGNLNWGTNDFNANNTTVNVLGNFTAKDVRSTGILKVGGNLTAHSLNITNARLSVNGDLTATGGPSSIITDGDVNLRNVTFGDLTIGNGSVGGSVLVSNNFRAGKVTLNVKTPGTALTLGSSQRSGVHTAQRIDIIKGTLALPGAALTSSSPAAFQTLVTEEGLHFTSTTAGEAVLNIQGGSHEVKGGIFVDAGKQGTLDIAQAATLHGDKLTVDGAGAELKLVSLHSRGGTIQGSIFQFDELNLSNGGTLSLGDGTSGFTLKLTTDQAHGIEAGTGILSIGTNVLTAIGGDWSYTTGAHGTGVTFADSSAVTNGSTGAIAVNGQLTLKGTSGITLDNKAASGAANVVNGSLWAETLHTEGTGTNEITLQGGLNREHSQLQLVGNGGDMFTSSAGDTNIDIKSGGSLGLGSTVGSDNYIGAGAEAKPSGTLDKVTFSDAGGTGRLVFYRGDTTVKNLVNAATNGHIALIDIIFSGMNTNLNKLTLGTGDAATKAFEVKNLTLSHGAFTVNGGKGFLVNGLANIDLSINTVTPGSLGKLTLGSGAQLTTNYDMDALSPFAGTYTLGELTLTDAGNTVNINRGTVITETLNVGNTTVTSGNLEVGQTTNGSSPFKGTWQINTITKGTGNADFKLGNGGTLLLGKDLTVGHTSGNSTFTTTDGEFALVSGHVNGTLASVGTTTLTTDNGVFTVGAAAAGAGQMVESVRGKIIKLDTAGNLHIGNGAMATALGDGVKFFENISAITVADGNNGTLTLGGMNADGMSADGKTAMGGGSYDGTITLGDGANTGTLAVAGGNVSLSKVVMDAGDKATVSLNGKGVLNIKTSNDGGTTYTNGITLSSANHSVVIGDTADTDYTVAGGIAVTAGTVTMGGGTTATNSSLSGGVVLQGAAEGDAAFTAGGTAARENTVDSLTIADGKKGTVTLKAAAALTVRSDLDLQRGALNLGMDSTLTSTGTLTTGAVSVAAVASNAAGTTTITAGNSTTLKAQSWAVKNADGADAAINLNASTGFTTLNLDMGTGAGNAVTAKSLRIGGAGNNTMSLLGAGGHIKLTGTGLGEDTLLVDGSTIGATLVVGKAGVEAPVTSHWATDKIELRGSGSTLRVDNGSFSATSLKAAGTITVGATLSNGTLAGSGALRVQDTDFAAGSKLHVASGYAQFGSDSAALDSAVRTSLAASHARAALVVTGKTLTFDGNLTANIGTTPQDTLSILPGAGGVEFGVNSLAFFDLGTVGQSDYAIKSKNSVYIDAGAQIAVYKEGGVKVGDGLKILEITDPANSIKGSWIASQASTNSRLLTLNMTVNADHTKLDGVVGMGNLAQTMPGMSGSMAAYLGHMVSTVGVDPQSPNAGVRFVSRASDYGYMPDDNRAATTMEGAAQAAVVGATPGMTLAASNAAVNAVTTRTSFASPLMDKTKAVAVHMDENGVSLDEGLSAGDGVKNGLGLWIMPLYQSENVWGMKSGEFKSGYSGDLGGVAVGADYTFADAFRVGLALNVGGGYAQSSGDFNQTDNNFNFWGLSLYGGWTMNNFGLTADVGYTSSYNKLTQEVPASMQMGGDLKSDVTSYAITAGLRGEYKIETSVMDILPHVGVRYTSLNVNEYDVKRSGTVFSVDQTHQSIWTFPVGVTFSRDIDMNNGWIFKPQVDLSVIPAAGDVKTKSKAHIPGVAGNAELETQVMDTMTWQGGLGFDIKNDNMAFGINYNIQASEHRTAHGVFGTFRYEF